MISLTHRERWFVFALFFFSLSLRFIYLAEIRHNPSFNHPRLDALYHDRWAQSIASGNVVGNEVFFRAPFYPYFLGLVYALAGHDSLAPRIIQHVLGSIGVVLLYFLTRRLFGRATAALASVFAATYAVLIYFEGELLFESVLTFSCVVLFLLLYSWKDHPNYSRWFGIGLVFGIICVTRPTFLPLLLGLVAYIVFLYRRKKGWRRTSRIASALVAGTGLVILPVTIRNYAVGEDNVLIASQGGINFFIGNNPGANGYSSMIPGPAGVSWENRDVDYHAEHELGHHAKPSELSNYWYAKGFAFIKDQPLHFLRLIIKKLYLFWNHFEIPNNQSFSSFQRYSELLRLLPTGFWCVGPLGLLGMFLAWRNQQARFTVVFVLSYLAVTVLFFVCDRYRLPVIPFLCIFSAYTVNIFIQELRARAGRWLAWHAVALLLLFALTNSNFYAIEQENKAQDILRLGIIEMEEGNYLQGSEYFKQCAQGERVSPNVFLNWGVCDLMLGHEEDAQRKFREELRRYPNSYGAMANLAYLYYRYHQKDSVITFAGQAIAEKPYSSAGYIHLAKALYEQQELTQAESVLVEGVKQCGSDFLYGKYLLAGIRLQEGRSEEAETIYRSLLEQLMPHRQPKYEPEFGFSLDYAFAEDPQVLQGKSFYGLGHVFVSRHQFDSAIAYFRASIGSQPSFGDAWIDLGIALQRSGQLDAADSAFARGLMCEPGNYRYWYSYSFFLRDMHRVAEARAALEKSLELNPRFAPARELLNRFSHPPQ